MPVVTTVDRRYLESQAEGNHEGTRATRLLGSGYNDARKDKEEDQDL